jgi:hypothetical protein
LKWQLATINAEMFDLSHLHPFSFILKLEPHGSYDEMVFKINVNFGLHCFTDALTENSLASHRYAEKHETRAFSKERYSLSKQLPEMIGSLDQRRCYEAKHNNYMTFEVIKPDGILAQYQVYFKVTLSGKAPGELTLFVQSAYAKNEPHKVQREKPCMLKAICAKVALKKK